MDGWRNCPYSRRFKMKDQPLLKNMLKNQYEKFKSQNFNTVNKIWPGLVEGSFLVYTSNTNITWRPINMYVNIEPEITRERIEGYFH